MTRHMVKMLWPTSRWTKLHSIVRLFLLVGMVFAFLTLPTWADSDFQVNEHQIKFDFTKPTENVSANHVVQITRKKQGEDAGAVTYWLDGELQKSSTGETIPASLILARTEYDSRVQSLDNPVMFLADGDDFAEISFYASKEAWNGRSHGEYTGWLKSSKGPDIRVHVHIHPYTAMGLSTESIHFHADEGPGIYDADEVVELTVISNMNDWTVWMSLTEPLVCDSDASLIVEPEAVRVAVDSPKTYDESQVLNPGVSLSGSKSMAKNLYFKVKTTWAHRAGRYTGRMFVTLSADNP